MVISGWSSIHRDLPGLVNIQKAIENCHLEIVDLPMKNGDFP
jgi:hypothetical protein